LTNVDYIVATGGPEALMKGFDPNDFPDTNYGRAMADQIQSSQATYDRLDSIQNTEVAQMMSTPGGKRHFDAQEN
jgi:hypothetical protein